jgi:transposase
MKPLVEPNTKAELQALIKSEGNSEMMVKRYNVALCVIDGMTNRDIAKLVSLNLNTVGRWRNRFLKSGIDGLKDLPRTGRPTKYNKDGLKTEILELLKKTPPRGEKGWTADLLGEKLQIVKAYVFKCLNELDIRLERKKRRKTS